MRAPGGKLMTSYKLTRSKAAFRRRRQSAAANKNANVHGSVVHSELKRESEATMCSQRASLRVCRCAVMLLLCVSWSIAAGAVRHCGHAQSLLGPTARTDGAVGELGNVFDELAPGECRLECLTESDSGTICNKARYGVYSEPQFCP